MSNQCFVDKRIFDSCVSPTERSEGGSFGEQVSLSTLVFAHPDIVNTGYCYKRPAVLRKDAGRTLWITATVMVDMRNRSEENRCVMVDMRTLTCTNVKCRISGRFEASSVMVDMRTLTCTNRNSLGGVTEGVVI